MTRADERRPPDGGYPWHDAALPAVPRSPAAVPGARAGLVTRSLANVVDVLVVVLLLAGGYAAVAVGRFLLGPTTFTFPAPPLATLLLLGLCVQALYFAATWAEIGSTYGDRLLGLHVGDDLGERLGWGRCTVRAVLCAFFPVGLLWVLVSRSNRSVQDVLLRTSVLYD
ncbi:RDD family protein [Geodermatophilus sp. SYSU D01186]